MKKLAITLIALLLVGGCHGQAPPATPGYSVNLTATPPSSDGNPNPYSYAVYRETITGSTCDPSTSANWKEITTASNRPSSPAYTDNTASGLSVCYLMVTYQMSQGTPSTPQNSGPSNVVQLTVPGVPLAPQLQQPTTQQQSATRDDKPAFLDNEKFTIASLSLTANIQEVRR